MTNDHIDYYLLIFMETRWKILNYHHEILIR